MELTPFTIYMIFTADNVRALMIWFAVLSGLVTFAAAVCWVGFSSDGDYEMANRFYKFIKRVGAPVFLIFITMAATIPSTKTLVAMYGIPELISAGKAVAESEIGTNAYKAVNKLLKDYVGDK